MALTDMAPADDTVESTTDSAETESSGGEYDIQDTVDDLTSPESNDENDTSDIPDGEPSDASTPESGTEMPAQAEWENFSPELLDQAGQLGFTLNDLKAIGSEDGLRVAVQKQIGLLNQALQEQQRQKNAPESGESPDEVQKILEDMAEDNFDPKLIEALEAVIGQNSALKENMQSLSSQSEQQRQALETQLQHVVQQAQVGEAQKAVDWFDTSVAALPESYSQLLGDGPSAKMDQKTVEYQNRDRLSRIALNFAQNWQTFGFSSSDDPRIVSSAAAAAFGEHAKTAARDDLKYQMQQNGRQITSRPTHTQKVPKDPRERAAHNADQHRLFQR